MSAYMLESEIRMLNQIAANFAWDSDEERAATAVADHLNRSWTAAMREQLLRADADESLPLSPLARRALRKVQLPA